ncbi:MAG TPA: mechanosensitive ion channel domain-containing protein [Acidobacteriaceae bacterium]|nr:mechanosensitive ion channel domain-containing protein [Acidobacteriaceae bacterium]
MATSPSVGDGAHRSNLFGRTALILITVLLVLLGLCVGGLWATRGAMANFAFLRTRRAAAEQSLVNLGPWQTVQTLAQLAVTAEEKEYARDAERLADHEVDQAFAAALRKADLQERHKVLTGHALALSQRVAQLQQEIAEDQAKVARLKGAGTGAAGPVGTAKNVASLAATGDSLKVAEAQLGLDKDELTDAQRDLDRATGNLSVRIQGELAGHEASMRKYDSEQQQDDGVTAVVSAKRHLTLYERLTAWFNQRGRYASVEQAGAEALSDVGRITAEHNALEARENAVTAAGSGGATLAEIQDSSTERQILSIDDDRIQTDKQLASVYEKWGAQLQLQHQILLHLILQSLEAILFIALGMIGCDALVRRLTEHPSVDRRQAHTLRTILRVVVQVVGILLIGLLVFGPPHQTGTIIGLATAALTISLQDYILAFLGWFMLVGRNGIRVGDMVEIDGVCGEVLEVGLMSTTLLETTGMAEKGEPTGRQVSLLNSFAIRGQYFNFSSDGQWMWDEITVSVPADENIYDIAKSVEDLAREETKESARLAEAEWKQRAHSTRLTGMSAAPVVMLRPTVPVVDIATGIDIQVRYVTRAVGRFEMRDRLYRHVIKLLQDANVAKGLPQERVSVDHVAS